GRNVILAHGVHDAERRQIERGSVRAECPEVLPKSLHAARDGVHVALNLKKGYVVELHWHFLTSCYSEWTVLDGVPPAIRIDFFPKPLVQRLLEDYIALASYVRARVPIGNLSTTVRLKTTLLRKCQLHYPDTDGTG